MLRANLDRDVVKFVQRLRHLSAARAEFDHLKSSGSPISARRVRTARAIKRPKTGCKLAGCIEVAAFAERIAIFAPVVTILGMIQRKFHEPVEPDGTMPKNFFTNQRGKRRGGVIRIYVKATARILERNSSYVIAPGW